MREAGIDAEMIAGYRTRVFRFILKSVHSISDAEDLAQRTLLTALQNRARFRGDSSLLTWLFGIALNMVRAHRRSRRRDALTNGEDTLAALPFEGDDPAAALSRRQNILRLRNAVAALPEDMREALVLVSLEGLSYEEAATVLSTPIGTVRSRIHRAKQMVRETLAANDSRAAGTHGSEPSAGRAAPKDRLTR